MNCNKKNVVNVLIMESFYIQLSNMYFKLAFNCQSNDLKIFKYGQKIPR